MHAFKPFVSFAMLCVMFLAPCKSYSQIFAPTDLTGLVLWLSGDSTETLSPPFINKCYDLSASANHAVQTNASFQPVIAPQTLNGHKLMRFDGQDDFLQFNNINSCKTIFWIIKEAPGTTGARPVLGHSGNYDFLRGGPPNFYLWNGAASSYVRNGLTRINSDSIDGTTTQLPNDFILLTLVTTVGTANAEFLSNDRMGAGSFWNGDVAEVIIYDQWLTISEVQQVENYLYEKYAPVANLGPDLTIANSFCDTTLSPGDGFTSYLWSTGETNPTITVNQTGQYWVQATGVFGNVSTDTINITFNTPVPNYLSDTVFCTQSVTWNTGLNNTNFNFQWQDNSTDSFLVINSTGTYSVSITDAFGCAVSSGSVTIVIDNFKQTASLGPDTTLCGNQYIKLVNGQSLAATFNWSGGSTNDSLLVTTSGQYILTASSANGCSMTDTIDIAIQPLPVFSLGNDTVVCYNQNFMLNPGTVSVTSYLWSDNSTADSLQIISSGVYWLRVTDSVGCTFTDSIDVSIDSTLFSYTLGADTSFCSGNYLAVNGSGGTAPVSFSWSDSSTNDSLQIQTAGNYSVTITNGAGCEKADTISVLISGIAPAVNFAMDTTCFGSASVFTDLSLPPSGSNLIAWNWNFGDGFTDTVQNAQHMYADTGLFVVSLQAITDSGCAAEITKSIHVYPNPDVNFSVANTCETATSSFLDMSNGFGYGIVSWSWNFNDPGGANNTASTQNANHSYVTAGTYSVQLIVKNSVGCTDSALLPITIKAKPVTGISTSNTCQNTPVNFSDSTILPSGSSIAVSYWDFGNFSTSSAVNVAYTYTATGTYNVLHYITASNGCTDSVYKTITVHPKPSPDFTFDPLLCVFDTIQFYDGSTINGGSIASRFWNFNNVSTDTATNPLVVFSFTGTKTIKLDVTSDKGCVAGDSAVIVINPAPSAAFTFSPPYGSNPLNVTFTNGSSGATAWLWEFGDSTQSNQQNPLHVYQDTGIYVISLTSINSYGCSRSVTDTLEVVPSRLDIAVIGLSLVETNNFVDVTALLQNLGTVDVTSLEMYVRLNNGAYMKENWSGTLNKGAVISYHFTSQLYGEKETDFICVQALKPNAADDEVASNNEKCSSLDSTRLLIYPLYPNPAEDIIFIPVNIPRAATFKASLFDANGKMVSQPYEEFLDKGFNFISFDLSLFESGMYCVKIEYQGKIIPVKFLKKRL